MIVMQRPVGLGGSAAGAAAAEGAVSGAVAGSVVPGIGTAIGAVVGGAAGYLKGKSAEDSAVDPEKLVLLQNKGIRVQAKALRATSRDETHRTWLWIGGAVVGLAVIGITVAVVVRKKNRRK